VWVVRTFRLAGSSFGGVPDFTQAHFEESPRLDNFNLLGRAGDENERPELSARWHALKRLAIKGHDTDRELEFFSQEVRAARFANDWPVPWPFWEGRQWAGFFRYYFGFLYEIFSDFGRSVFRPFLVWVIGVLAFAAFYLSQTDVMQRDLALEDAWSITAAAKTGRYALSNAVPCYPPPPTFTEKWRRWQSPPKSTPASKPKRDTHRWSQRKAARTNERTRRGAASCGSQRLHSP